MIQRDESSEVRNDFCGESHPFGGLWKEHIDMMEAESFEKSDDSEKTKRKLK